MIEVYLLEKDSVVSKTVTAGVITAITKAVGKKYFKWELQRSTAEMKEDGKISEENGTQYMEQLVDMVFNKMDTNKRNEILLLAKGVTDCIVRDSNGKYWNPGFLEGMSCSAIGGGTGKAKGDRNGYSIQLKGEEGDFATEVSQAAVDTLLTVGV